jgi:DNA-binding transcriptional MerR regulator
MTGAATARGTSGEPVMSIGEVLSRLRPEFPDVTISKLRFLEAEGLVEPYRAPSGYRKYAPAHLERLRFILTAQRDRYLPLRVIREQIEALDRGERVLGLPNPPPVPAVPSPAPPGPAEASPAPPPGPSGISTPAPRPAPPGATAAPPPMPRPTPTGTGTGTSPGTGAGSAALAGSAGTGVRLDLGDGRLSREQLAERSGLNEAGLVDLERYGLLVLSPDGAYSGEALTVARVAAQLGEFGIEARHLRPYRTTADREVGLLAQLLPPLTRQAGLGGRAQALETVHELAALCAQLHGALVRQGLRQVLGA